MSRRSTRGSGCVLRSYRPRNPVPCRLAAVPSLLLNPNPPFFRRRRRRRVYLLVRMYQNVCARLGFPPGASGRRRQALEGVQRAIHLVLVERDVLEVAGEVVVVGAHVEVPVTGQVEEDRALLAC